MIKVNSEYDYNSYVEHTYFYQRKINPYDYIDGYYYAKYPAFYYYFMTLLGLMGIHSITALKFIYVSFSVINAYLSYKIYDLFDNGCNKNHRPLLLPVFLFFFPLHIFFSYHGDNDSVSIFFQLLAVYYFLKKSWNISALFLSLGIMFKIFPIFFLIPASVYFINTKKIKEGVRYWLLIGLLFLLMSMYFLVVSPNKYLEGIFIQTRRSPDGWGYTEVFPSFFDVPLFEILWFDIAGFFILSILSIGLVFLFFLKYFKEPNKRAILVMSFFSLLLPSVVSFQDNITVYPRYFPFLSIIFLHILKTDRKQEFAAILIIVILNFGLALLTWWLKMSIPIPLRFLYLLLFYIPYNILIRRDKNKNYFVLIYFIINVIAFMGMIAYPYEETQEYRLWGIPLFFIRMFLYFLFVVFTWNISKDFLRNRRYCAKRT